MQKFFLTALAAVLFFNNMNAQEAYKIYDTRAGKVIGTDEIVSAFSNADVLFFGEEHNDSIGHMLELKILEKAYKAIGDDLVLSMEMFETDVQLVVDEYLAGYIKEKNLKKEGRAWSNYDDYRPLVEYAREKGIPVVAANTPARYTGSVSRNGYEVLEKLSRDAKEFLPPLPIDTAEGRYLEKFREVMGEHADMPGLHMFQAQNLWDASMAYSISKVLKKYKTAKVYHLNGKFHTDEKLGIPAQLAKYMGKKKVTMLNISCFPDENFGAPDWSKYEQLGDFIIITKPAEKEEKEKD